MLRSQEMSKERFLGSLRRLKNDRVLRPVVNDEEAKDAYFERRVPMPDEECKVVLPPGSVLYINGEYYMICKKEGLEVQIERKSPTEYTRQRRTKDKFEYARGRKTTGWVVGIHPDFVK